MFAVKSSNSAVKSAASTKPPTKLSTHETSTWCELNMASRPASSKGTHSSGEGSPGAGGAGTSTSAGAERRVTAGGDSGACSSEPSPPPPSP